MKQTKNPREAAYLALFSSLKQQSYVADFLEEWRRNSAPSTVDYQLAREIAFGSVRMARALDYFAEHLADRGKLSFKVKEKALLRTALYQHYFLDKIPLYAIVNETVDLGKKYCHSTFVKFLNALLRKVEDKKVALPQGRSLENLAIHYSYPEYFIEALIQDYGLEKTLEILETQNRPSLTMCRIRTDLKQLPEGVEPLEGCHATIAKINDPIVLEQVAHSPDYYIQNVTPAELISSLAEGALEPKTVLDLCASPGGKLIAVHDRFPEAKLFGNDVSQGKLRTLEENLEKYGIKAVLNCGKGEDYPEDQKFDLILLDVPCSNSGVLHKRAEARWRISPESLLQIQELQRVLLKKAVGLLNPGGEIWYLTCSILEQENGSLVEETCEALSLDARKQRIILPNREGWDGGFGCALRKKAGI